MNPSIFTVPEAATAIGIDEQRLRAAIRRGDVAADWTGGRYLLAQETVKQLAGAHAGAAYLNEDKLMNITTNLETGRRELTGEELAEFVTTWNEKLSPLGREGVEARGFALVPGPGGLALDWPLAEDRRIVVTIQIIDRAWTPVATIDPAAAGNLLEHLTDGLADIQRLANAKASHSDIVGRAVDLQHAALRASCIADNAATHLSPIPDNVAIEGVAYVYEPEGENEAAA